ncbi:MAG: hypothetical protein E2590_07385 [Chryseobacterium sp.]|nr:hypothetical protein [Chryseobacterium sp.]
MINYGNYKEVKRNNNNDFIPIVEIDLNQLGKENKTKEWKYDGFEINTDNKKITLNENIDEDKRNHILYTIKLNQNEVVVKFLVKQANSKASDNDGYIEVKPKGVNVLTKKKISIEYGKPIALRISTKNLQDGAYIDFYASDDGGTFDSLGLTNIHCGRILVFQKSSCLVLYGSGWLSPTAGSNHHAGEAFKIIAEARNKLNQQKYEKANCKIFYTPTDVEFFEKINKTSGIVRLDVYCHAWQLGLNLGGFEGKRSVGGVVLDGDKIDWSNKNQDGGTDLRRVETNENLYLNSKEVSELLKIKKEVFKDNCEIYFWGCNAGGQLSPTGIHIASNNPLISNPKETFAQYFAKHIGVGNVFALVGKGEHAGSMFKTDANGKNYYDDGEMIPANISGNYKDKNTKSLNAINYMKKFPL